MSGEWLYPGFQRAKKVEPRIFLTVFPRKSASGYRKENEKEGMLPEAEKLAISW